MSQITSLVKAEKAAEKVRVLVAMAVVTARKAHAPTANGSSTRPAMVETKIERRFQPCMVMPSGTGTRKRRANPREMERMNGIGFAPGQTGAGAGGVGTAAAADAEATTGEAVHCWRIALRVGKVRGVATGARRRLVPKDAALRLLIRLAATGRCTGTLGP